MKSDLVVSLVADSSGVGPNSMSIMRNELVICLKHAVVYSTCHECWLTSEADRECRLDRIPAGS